MLGEARKRMRSGICSTILLAVLHPALAPPLGAMCHREGRQRRLPLFTPWNDRLDCLLGGGDAHAVKLESRRLLSNALDEFSGSCHDGLE